MSGMSRTASLDYIGLVNTFGTHLKERGKKEATIQSYCRDVLFFLEHLLVIGLPLNHVDEKLLHYYQEEVKRTNRHGKQNSIRRSVIAIRQFFRFLSKETSSSPFDEYPIPTRFENHAPRMQIKDLERLIELAKHAIPIKAERDQVILCLLGFEGVKVSELIDLEWSDFLCQKGQGTLLIRGERARVLILAPITKELLLKYKQRLVQENNPKLADAKLLVGFSGKDSLTPQPKVSRHGLKFMLYELGSACKLRKLNSEKLRHHSVSYLLSQGKTPDDVMKHLGLRRLGNIRKHMR
ncbi:MAG: site-specific integrase [Deltaproteobacteria bacterium]|nr:site-specific integrase [Deltaproteobacteria bacterium]